MIIGHLPAGYLAATVGLDRANVAPAERRWLLGAALAGSVAPDLDILAFYTVGGDVHHHAYPTHWPMLWLAVTVVSAGIALLVRRPLGVRLAFTFGAATLLHLALDSIAGAVQWGAPFSDRALTLVEVPARFESWVTSMVLHWTFAVEVALWIAAGFVFLRRRRRSRT
ncbi:MAG: metal-dependent hydrolase [Bacteroidota bacterium]